MYKISIFLESQLFHVLCETVFVKLKVTVMQVPKAIKGGSNVHGCSERNKLCLRAAAVSGGK